ncbi:MAG: DUF4442 domain-containing protein [Myxococcus sp.]|nr:DUF4442 domain-containing protein [Myxococcus sp.]
MTTLVAQLKALVSPSQLLTVWQRLKGVPSGGRLMGRLAGLAAPYTGSISPEVLSLEAGTARVLMRDTRRVRNHLSSLHAAALMNLAEMTTGLAVVSALPEGLRGIPTHVGMDYLKKARGPITAECTCPVITSTQRQDLEVHAELKNAEGEVVARALAKWRVGA